MVYVSIQHVIGSVALIGLVLSVVLAYNNVVGWVREDAIRTQLRQVAEYVSMSMTKAINLMDFTYGYLSTSDIVSKRVSLPPDIGGRPYYIALAESSAGNSKYYYVKVGLAGTSIEEIAYIPITEGPESVSRIHLYTGNAEDLPIGLLEGSGIEPVSMAYGGNPGIVVWCRKFEDVLYIGLGLSGGSG